MYRLEYLPIAKQDISDIVQYISVTLDNPTAAARLLNKMEESTERIKEQPYSCPVHFSVMPLEHEYRKLIVHNYIIFYYVNEEYKTLTIVRVIYGGRDYVNMPF